MGTSTKSIVQFFITRISLCSFFQAYRLRGDNLLHSHQNFSSETTVQLSDVFGQA